MNHPASCLTWPQSKPLHRVSKSKLDLQVCDYDDVTVVFCKGRIAYREEATAFSAKVSGLLPHTHQLVLELSGVEVIDSAGLGELVVVLMWTQACECSIKLAGPRKHIQELLELTNLISVFEIHPTLLDAMLAFQSQPERF